MLLSKDYVGYLAREVTKKLIAAKAIETSVVPKVAERVHAALLEELTDVLTRPSATKRLALINSTPAQVLAD